MYIIIVFLEEDKINFLNIFKKELVTLDETCIFDVYSAAVTVSKCITSHKTEIIHLKKFILDNADKVKEFCLTNKGQW